MFHILGKFLKCRTQNLQRFLKTTSTFERQSVLKIGDTRVYYARVGRGKHVVFLLPGILGTVWSDYTEQFKSLSKEDFILVSWDPPGYGRSRPPNRTFDKDYLKRDAELVPKVMEELNFQSYSLVGYSEGGVTAILTAAKDPKVRKLVVFGCKSFVDDRDLSICQGYKESKNWPTKSYRTGVAMRTYGPVVLDRLLRGWYENVLEIHKEGGDFCRSVLQDVKAPTLVLHGRKDDIVSSEHAEFIHGGLADSQLLIIQGDHLAHIDDAKEFNKEETVHIEDRKVNFLKVGDGSHPVLCLPGALGSIWSDFGGQIKGMDKSKFTVVAWDPPGYGKSRPPERVFDSKVFHTDAKIAGQLMQRLGYESYSALGWSDGGNTGLIMASDNPSLRKLVVWGANSYFGKEDVKIFQGIRDTSKWSERMRRPLTELYGPEGLQSMMSSLCDVYVRLGEENGGSFIKNILPKISCPTLILHGDKDPLVGEEHPEYIAEGIRNSRLYRFKEGKHNIHLRYPEEFNSVVQEFLLS